MYVFRVIEFKAVVRLSKSCRTYCWEKNLNNDQILSEARIEQLKDRSVLSISGLGAGEFLQGLITNDINFLRKDKQSIYTTFLNSRGRVIHDAIIYKSTENGFLLESDTSSIDALQIHLTMHQSRKQIFIENRESLYSVWAIFNPSKIEKPFPTTLISQGTREVCDLSFIEEIDFGDEAIVCYDPRILSLGIRIVAPREFDIIDLIKLNGYHVKRAPPGGFKSLRYKLGICEGINEIQYGLYHPSELNCDYLNVLNNKDDYLGLNALKKLTNLNGVKRIMPIKFLSNKNNNIPINTPVLDLERRKKTPLGYIRGINGLFGIALLRVSGLEEKDVRVGNSLAQYTKPLWWPDSIQSFTGKQNIRSA